MSGATVRTFIISAKGLRRLLWRSARTSFAVTVLLIAIAISLPLRNEEALDQRTFGWILFYLFAVLIAGTWLSTRSTRRTWTSYRLELSPTELRRIQNRVPEISIARNEATGIEALPSRGLMVRTADSEKFVFIPEDLEDFADVRSELTQWAPVQTISMSTTWRRQWLGLSVALLIVAWMVSTMLSQMAAFVVPSAFAISVFLLWALIAAQRSLHLDRRTKLSMWLVMFPILGLTLKTTYLLASLAIPK
jgi:hypothetical protein